MPQELCLCPREILLHIFPLAYILHYKIFHIIITTFQVTYHSHLFVHWGSAKCNTFSCIASLISMIPVFCKINKKMQLLSQTIWKELPWELFSSFLPIWTDTRLSQYNLRQDLKLDWVHVLNKTKFLKPIFTYY